MEKFCRSYSVIFLISGMMALVLITNGQVLNGTGNRDVIHSIPLTGSSQDITWDTKHLWVVDDLAKKFHKLETVDGSVVASYPYPDEFMYGHGIAFDGRDLWLCGWEVPDGTGSKLMRINFDSLGILATLDYPGDYTGNWPHGITYAGSFLWANNLETHTLDKIHPNTGELLATLPAPTENSVGVAWDGQSLWTMDPQLNLIYKQDAATGMVLGTIATPAEGCTGLAWDDDYLWVISPETAMAYQVDVDELNAGEQVRLPFTLYPNPGKGMFHVHIEAFAGHQAVLTILDLQGKPLMSIDVNEDNSTGSRILLDLNEFPDGLYLIKFDNTTQTACRKLIISR